MFGDNWLRGILTPIQIKSHTMRYVFILMVILCTSCGTALPTVKPYKLDVQQGNVVTSKMLLQLRPGMTKSQVRFIMGTPLIQDSFHGNRWDYVYQLRENGKIKEQRRVILDFENELLKTVRGDVVPSGSEAAKSVDEVANTGTRVIQPNKKSEEKSLISKLKFWESDEDAVSAEKAKRASETAAKKAVALESEKAVPIENPQPAQEVKSILAVPLEVAPAVVAPVVEASPVPVVVMPEASIPVASAVEAPIENHAVAPAPVAITRRAYESPSGMLFDDELRTLIEAEVKPAVVAPRAGNKTAPKPKDLPAEGAPGFFDRMLEKIGF